MTILEVITRGSDFLAKKNVESPRLNAELITAHVLKVPRMKLYLNFDRELSGSVVDEIRAGIVRRGAREPLQHITGTTSFCGIELQVDRRCLIPRPETELLAELALRKLRSNPHTQLSALDFGTGSGCIAIALAREIPNLEIHASDVSSEALALAYLNADRNGLSHRICFHQGDGFQNLPRQLRFSLVVANPPYIPTGELEHLEPEVRDFDPRLALDGGADGLMFYRLLASAAKPFLLPGGSVIVEFGDSQGDAIAEIFQKEMWIVESLQADYSRRPRFLNAAPNF